MTAIQIQLQRRAIALLRAAEIAQSLDPLSEPLNIVLEEPNPDDVYLLAEAVVSLAKTCVEQRQHIAELGERIEKLEQPTK